MSHVQVISNVPVKDIQALEAAIDELKEQGVAILLSPNKGPRLYSKEQTQQYANKCQYTIELPKAKYDIGLREVKNEEGDFVRYDLITDPYTGTVAQQVGFPEKKDKTPNEYMLGRLMQSYTKYAVINLALKQGANVADVTVDANGNVQMKLIPQVA